MDSIVPVLRFKRRPWLTMLRARVVVYISRMSHSTQTLVCIRSRNLFETRKVVLRKPNFASNPASFFGAQHQATTERSAFNCHTHKRSGRSGGVQGCHASSYAMVVCDFDWEPRQHFRSCLDTPWGMRLEPHQVKLTVKAPDQARASKAPIDALLIHEILTAIIEAGPEVSEEVLGRQEGVQFSRSDCLYSTTETGRSPGAPLVQKS